MQREKESPSKENLHFRARVVDAMFSRNILAFETSRAPGVPYVFWLEQLSTLQHFTFVLRKFRDFRMVLKLCSWHRRYDQKLAPFTKHLVRNPCSLSLRLWPVGQRPRVCGHGHWKEVLCRDLSCCPFATLLQIPWSHSVCLWCCGVELRKAPWKWCSLKKKKQFVFLPVVKS